MTCASGHLVVFYHKPWALFPGGVGTSGTSLYDSIAAEVLRSFLGVDSGVVLGTDSDSCHWVMLPGAISSSLVFVRKTFTLLHFLNISGLISVTELGAQAVVYELVTAAYTVRQCCAIRWDRSETARGQGSQTHCWVWVLARRLPSCVLLGFLLNHSELQFPHTQNGKKNPNLAGED